MKANKVPGLFDFIIKYKQAKINLLITKVKKTNLTFWLLKLSHECACGLTKQLQSKKSLKKPPAVLLVTLL